MTAVIGILSKKGVALAADSAVTRKREKHKDVEEKITNNGNKMIRLCESSPICMMVTGSAEFLEVPWDIIVRRYRSVSGSTPFSSMEDVVTDFFEYLSKSKEYWDKESIDKALASTFLRILDDAKQDLTPDAVEWDDRTDMLLRPGLYKRELSKALYQISRTFSKAEECPQFKGYTVEQFATVSLPALEKVFSLLDESNRALPARKRIPRDILEYIRPALVSAALSEFSHRNEANDYTLLVFCGYCKDSKYPSLISVVVNAGVDQRVNYHYYRREIVRISDRHPVAICPFACTDVMESILCGASPQWEKDMFKGFSNLFSSDNFCVDCDERLDETDFLIMEAADSIRHKDLCQNYKTARREFREVQKEEWEKLVRKQDLKSMADFAEDLIYLTAFYRALTFEQEGVGGLIDKATISKKDGFTWLNRKSWYHHVDTDGEHGELGI